MDKNRFDTWTRTLSAADSRRAASRVLAGSALTALLTQLGVTPAAAKKGRGKGKGKGKKKDCGKGKKPCGRSCIPQANCCTIDDCDQCRNEFCQNGRCACLEGSFEHHGRCGRIPGPPDGPSCWTKGHAFGDDEPFFNCCSGKFHIEGEGTGAPYYVCDAGISGCLTDIDCVSGPCRGYVCPEQQVGCPGGPPL